MIHMVEKTENNKMICIKCGLKLLEDNKIKNYPSIFLVYLCPQCGNENDWWTLGFDKGKNVSTSNLMVI